LDAIAADPPPPISLLALELGDYVAKMTRSVTTGEVIAGAALQCTRCGASCARPHAWRRRKRVRDVPILRVRFCDGHTGSLIPAALWRGRCTVESVLESALHVLSDGIEAAHDWARAAGEAPLVSRTTPARWGEMVRQRVLGGAWSWLAPRLDLSWSAGQEPAVQLERLLDRLGPTALLAFRDTLGRALLDAVSVSRPRPVTRSPARRVAGRLAVAPPPDPARRPRPRGAWSPCTPRGPPPRRPP